MTLRELYCDCLDAKTVFMAMVRTAAFPHFPVRARARALIAAKPELKPMGTNAVADMILEIDDVAKTMVDKLVSK